MQRLTVLLAVSLVLAASVSIAAQTGEKDKKQDRQSNQGGVVVPPPADIITRPLTPDTGRQIEIGTDIPLQEQAAPKESPETKRK